MRTLLILVLLILINISGFAECDSTANSVSQSKKLVLGANISCFTNFDLSFKDGYSFTTSFVINRGKSSLMISPIWWIDKNKTANIFRGGMLSYLFFYDKSKNRINFFFEYNLAYIFEKNNWERSIEYFPNIYYNVSFQSTWHSVVNQIGYGFIFKINDRLNVNQSMSIGISWYNFTSNTDVIGNESLSENYSSGGIFSDSDISSFLKIGIGYNFEK